MSFEQMPKEELNPKAKKELEELEEKNLASPIVAYLKTLTTKDLRILDNALNRASSSFLKLNYPPDLYEEDEEKKAIDILKEIVAEPDQTKHKEILKNLP
jgi:hypothetical protein